MYYTASASLAGLFDLLLKKENPVIRPKANLKTTADKFEAFFPEELLVCISPSEGTVPGKQGGRPRKSQNPEASASYSGNSSSSWKKSSYLPFLYNAYKNARARREAMISALKKNPAKILLSAEKKAQSVLYPDGIPCFDTDQLEEVLTDASCIPALLPQDRQQYAGQMHYYMRTSPERALSRALIALLFADQYAECKDILFPPLDYADDQVPLLFRADRFFQNGQYKEARDLYQAVADDLKNPDRPEALLKIGKLYQYGYGFQDVQSWAQPFFEEALQAADPQSETFACASWELYRCETSDSKALFYLTQAADHGNLDALRELGGIYYAGSSRFQISPNLEKAAGIYQKGAQAKDPVCERMYGKCMQREGKMEKAKYWFLQAAMQGDTEASVLWAEMDPLEVHRKSEDDTSRSQLAAAHSASSAGICFLNANNEMANTFAASLPKGWTTKSFASFETSLKDIIGSNTSSASILVFLSSEEEGNNLKDLDHAIFLLEHMSMDDSVRKELIRQTHFYVRTGSDDDLAVKMVDSFHSVNELRRKLAKNSVISKKDRKEWFYRIRICNPARDASRYLLSHAPLFLPSIEDPRMTTHVVILGGGDLVIRLIADILSVFPYTKSEKPLAVSIFSENADQLKDEIEETMPELFKDKNSVSCDLSFITLSKHMLREIFLYKKNGKNGENQASNTGCRDSISVYRIQKDGAKKDCAALSSDLVHKELQRILFEANYYIVAGSDEADNVKTATWLRGTLLASASQFGTLPFIAVYVHSNLLARQASHFSVINEGFGFSWYNNYNLFCFGSSRDLYTWHNLEDNYLDQRALALHKSYYGHTGNAIEQAEADYWCRFYNRDSSQMSALSAIYKAYLAGSVLKSWMEYGQADSEAALVPDYCDWLKDPEHLEQAARMEHQRWSSFAVTRGWQQADIEQLRQYLRMGNPHQQLYLARLHPCLVSWQRLPEVQSQYNAMQKQINPEWKDQDLIRSDYDIVQLVPEILAIT